MISNEYFQSKIDSTDFMIFPCSLSQSLFMLRHMFCRKTLILHSTISHFVLLEGAHSPPGAAPALSSCSLHPTLHTTAHIWEMP